MAVLTVCLLTLMLDGVVVWLHLWHRRRSREQMWFDSLRAIVERNYEGAEAVATRLQEQSETASIQKEMAFFLRRIIGRAAALEANLREEHYTRCELEDVLATLQDAVLVVDEKARLRFLNVAAGRFFDVKIKDVLGAQVLEALPSLDLENMIRTALRDGQDSSREIRLYAPRLREVLLRVTPIRRSDGYLTGVMAILQDLTEVRHLERVRRDFVANASHELRTPIANIRASAETLLSAPDDLVLLARFLPKVLTEAQRMSRLINDLLDLARIESDAQVRPVAVDLVALIDDVVCNSKDKALQHQIELQCEIRHGANGGIKVMGDPNGLEQVVFNLLDNALLYTPSGGRITLEVETKGSFTPLSFHAQRLKRPSSPDRQLQETQRENERAPDGQRETGDRRRSYVTLSVTDTGMGIPQEDLIRIFERFYRVDQARSRAQGGTGLGLAIVKHIVEDHGGYIEVHSEVSRGTTFRVTLPVGQIPLSDS